MQKMPALCVDGGVIIFFILNQNWVEIGWVQLKPETVIWGSPESLTVLMQVGVFYVGQVAPLVHAKSTEVSRIEFILNTVILGSVDHFFGIYITNFPSGGILNVGLRVTCNIAELYTIEGVAVKSQT